MEIVKIIKSMPTNIINSCKKIYGTCRHQNKFHWLNRQSKTSTDEGGTQKKVKASGFSHCKQEGIEIATQFKPTNVQKWANLPHFRETLCSYHKIFRKTKNHF
jgi:hypothetical protein